jgi:hypothetical protein
MMTLPSCKNPPHNPSFLSVKNTSQRLTSFLPFTTYAALWLPFPTDPKGAKQSKGALFKMHVLKKTPISQQLFATTEY